MVVVIPRLYISAGTTTTNHHHIPTLCALFLFVILDAPGRKKSMPER
jgi:hypothetical protein